MNWSPSGTPNVTGTDDLLVRAAKSDQALNVTYIDAFDLGATRDLVRDLRAEVERLQAAILSLQSDEDIARISELEAESSWGWFRRARAAEAEVKRLQAIESALIDFLDALMIAKRNDDVMSVVDAMLAVHVEAEINRAVSPTPTEPDGG